MKTIRKPLRLIAFIILSQVLITGCGSEDSSTATIPDPGIEFPSFPSGLFTEGLANTTNYTGTGSDGSRWEATISEQTLAQSTFLGQPAIPILKELQLTNTSTGGTIPAISTEYYTTVPNDRHYLGFRNSETETVTAVTSAIPLTAKIGDSGIIGTYTDNAGAISEQTWRLEDGLNGRAKRVVITTEKDQSDTVTSIITLTNIIETNGNLIASNLVIEFINLGLTLTFDGS